MSKKIILFFFVILTLTNTACTLATIRSLEEDAQAKEGFNADNYIESIWESLYMPAVNDNALEVGQFFEALDANPDQTINNYGKRTGTGAYSFLIRGEAQVLTVDTESRIGLMAVDFAPYDGVADASIAIGPVIRRRNIAATDAVGFIRFNDFVNQTEFAAVSDAIKDRIVRDVLSTLDLPNLAGKTIRFIGAFTFDDVENIEIVPIVLEVQS